MSTVECPVPASKLVRESYLVELTKFCQRKAGTKKVSSGFAESKCSKLDSTDKTGVNFWQKLVGYCLSHRLDYTRLIKAFFMSQDSLSNFMLLRHDGIFSTATLSVYESLKPSVDACKSMLVSNRRTLIQHMDRQELLNGIDPQVSAETALSVTASPYCALFRYCMLHQMEKNPDPWFVPAFRQYSPDRESYDKAWGDFIPSQLSSFQVAERRAS